GHDATEVQVAEAHEDRRDAETLHQQEGKEHGQRDDRRRDQRRPDIAEEEKQYQDDEEGALEQVLEDGMRRPVHHLSLIVERSDRYAFGQQPPNVFETPLDQRDDF